MAYRPDDLLNQEKPITINKVELSKEASTWTPEQYEEYAKRTLLYDPQALAKSTVIGLEQGFYKGLAKQKQATLEDKYYDIFKRQLASIGDININKLTPELEEQIIQQLKDDPSTKSDWLDTMLKYREKAKSNEIDVRQLMNYYNVLDDKKLNLINGMSNEFLRGCVAPLTSGVAEGLGDYTNLIKQIGITTAASLASPAVAGGLGAIGLKNISEKAITLGISKTLETIDNYVTNDQERELIDPNAPPLTFQEKMTELLIDTIADFGFDALGYYGKEFINSFFKNTPDINSKAKDISVNESTEVSIGNTTTKQIAKEVYDAENGKNSANIKIFKDEMSSNLDIKYDYKLDPTNNSWSIDSGKVLIDNVDGSLYTHKANSDIKYDVNQLMPTSEDIKDIRETKEILQYKADNEIPLDEPLTYTPKDISKDFYIYDGSDNVHSIKVSHDAIQALDKLKGSPMGSYFTTADSNDNISYVIKLNDKEVVKVTRQDIKQPDIGTTCIDSFDVRELKNLWNKKVEILDVDGNFKNVVGTKKFEYIRKMNQSKIYNVISKNLYPIGIDLEKRGRQVKDNKVAYIGANIKKTTDDFTRMIKVPVENKANQIIKNNFDNFKRTMVDPDTKKPYFRDYADLLKHINPRSLSKALVTREADATMFIKMDNPDKVAKQFTTWINTLVDNNTLLMAFRNKYNLEIDLDDTSISSLYKHFLKYNDETGTYDFNTDKGAFFENLTNAQIEEKILDMFINPEKIDIGLIDNAVGLTGRDVFYHVFEDFTVDKQNGMAINRVFNDDKKSIELLRDFNIIKFDSMGDITSTLKDCVQGISNIIKEIANPNTKYNIDDLNNILKSFSSDKNLPKKYMVDTRKEEAINLFDFIFNNKYNGKVDMKEFHNIIEPFIENLSTYVDTQVDDINKLLSSENLNLKLDKDSKVKFDKVLSTLSKWNNKINSKSGTNNYLLSKQFKDEFKKVQSILSEVNIDEVKLLDDIKGIEYNGSITFDNLKDNVSPIVRKLIENNKKDLDVYNSVQDIKKTIGRKRNIDDIVNNESFKASVDNISKKLKNYGIDDDTINKLRSNNHQDIKSAIKNIESVFETKKKKSNNAINSLQELEVLQDPEEIEKYIKHVRNRNKVKTALDTMSEFGVSQDVVNDIKDFVNYNGKDFDYKINKENLTKNIITVSNRLNDIISNIDVNNYGERRKAYRTLLSRYNQISNLIKDKTAHSSVAFIKNKDIDLIYEDISKANKVLGKDVIELNGYKDIFISLQNVLNNIQESSKESLLKKINNKNIDTYRYTTLAEKQTFGRLESVINKRKWLEHNQWFKLNENNQKIILNTIYENLEDIPDNMVQDFVKPDKVRYLKQMYEYAKSKFQGLNEYDANGNIINSQPLTFDQFAFIYANFLDDLSNTTRINKRFYIGALEKYFNSKEDMLNFFLDMKSELDTGYVKKDKNVLADYNIRNSNDISELLIYGTSASNFSKTLSLSNNTFNQYINKNAPKIKQTIVKPIEGTTDVTEVYKAKKPTQAFADVLQGVSKNLRQEAISPNPMQQLLNNNEIYVDTLFKFMYSVMLNAKGLIEIATTPITSTPRAVWEDVTGKSFGYGGRKHFKKSRLYSEATKEGIKRTAISFANIPFNAAAGTWNFVIELDRYLFFSNLYNRLTGKDVDLKITSTGIDRVVNTLVGADKENAKYILESLADITNEKSLLKNIEGYAKPTEISFIRHPIEYTKTAFKSAIDAFSKQALAIQELSDLLRSVDSHIKSKLLMEEFLDKSFEELPEQIVSTLRAFNVDETNYNQFTTVLKNLSSDGKSLSGINLRDLSNEKSKIINDILKTQDSDILNTIEGLSSYFYHEVFDLNKTFDVLPASAQTKFQRINQAFKRTTNGMGIGSLSKITETKNEAGVYVSKKERIKNADKKAQAIINTLSQSASSVGCVTLAVLASTSIANILETMVSKPMETTKELATQMTEWSDIKDIITSDDNIWEKTIKSMGYLSFMTTKELMSTFGISSLLNSGNVLENLTPYIGDFYITLQKVINEAPDTVDKETLKWVVGKFGSHIKYDAQEHLDQPNQAMPMLFLFGSMFANIFAKQPMNIIEYMKKRDDDLEHAKLISKGKRSFIKQSSKDKFTEYYHKIQSAFDTPNQNDFRTLYAHTEELSDDGYKVLGTSILYGIDNLYNEVAPQMKAMEIQKANDSIEYIYQGNKISDEEYNNYKKEIYKSLDIENIIAELPPRYKLAIKTIEKNNPDILGLEKDELYINILKDIERENIDPKELINKYTKDDSNYQSLDTNKKINSYQYTTFDELPPKYKLYYLKANKLGQDISKEDVINLANSSTIPKQPQINI